MYQSLKNAARWVANKAEQFVHSKTAQLATGGTAVALATAPARAELPAAVGTAFTAVMTDASALQTIVIPIVVGVLGLMITISLIKRFGSKI